MTTGQAMDRAVTGADTPRPPLPYPQCIAFCIVSSFAATAQGRWVSFALCFLFSYVFVFFCIIIGERGSVVAVNVARPSSASSPSTATARRSAADEEAIVGATPGNTIKEVGKLVTVCCSKSTNDSSSSPRSSSSASSISSCVLSSSSWWRWWWWWWESLSKAEAATNGDCCGYQSFVLVVDVERRTDFFAVRPTGKPKGGGGGWWCPAVEEELSSSSSTSSVPIERSRRCESDFG